MTILLADADAARLEEMNRRCKAIASNARTVPLHTAAEAADVTKTVEVKLAVLNLECVSMTWAQAFQRAHPGTELLFTVDSANRSREELNDIALAAYGLSTVDFLLLPIDWEQFDHAMKRGLALETDTFQQTYENHNMK